MAGEAAAAVGANADAATHFACAIGAAGRLGTRDIDAHDLRKRHRDLVLLVAGSGK